VTLDTAQFVDALTETCRDPAVSGTISLLQKPPGRKAAEELKSLSAWYNSQTAEQQKHIAAVAALAADQTLFGVLCVLDGVRTIESTPTKSKFRLTCTSGRVATVLAPGSEFLHDIYRSHP
jgi:hypothetical protein